MLHSEEWIFHAYSDQISVAVECGRLYRNDFCRRDHIRVPGLERKIRLLRERAERKKAQPNKFEGAPHRPERERSLITDFNPKTAHFDVYCAVAQRRAQA